MQCSIPRRALACHAASSPLLEDTGNRFPASALAPARRRSPRHPEPFMLVEPPLPCCLGLSLSHVELRAAA